ncbi:hypothetical protein GWC77_26805 [Paraburkholderia sp. NMBU_R16]|uniref:hypothetical protein n=1 Tax=Paraburkholderia sp. NMBU_R16 TaxID=2698676 RepID=UPI0015649F36|nr:hypothetical protein [Paraburkholderia sp. NMBU_R16]NRO99490.1 hypothetical protein [Paraburkholderia sp. NMBU_R16]
MTTFHRISHSPEPGMAAVHSNPEPHAEIGADVPRARRFVDPRLPTSTRPQRGGNKNNRVQLTNRDLSPAGERASGVRTNVGTAERTDVVTRDGEGFALRRRAIYRWDNGAADWRSLDLSGIRKLKLGANGQAYAASDGGLWRLDDRGAQLLTRLTRGDGKLIDFAISSIEALTLLKKVPRVDDAHWLYWVDAIGAKRTRLPLPAPSQRSSDSHRCIHPVSIAIGTDGCLYVLDDRSQMWRGYPDDIAERGACAWRRLDVPEYFEFTHITTLADGAIAAEGLRAVRPGHEKGSWWSLAPGDRQWRWGSIPLLKQSYARFAGRASSTANVILGTPFMPGNRPIDTAGTSLFQRKLAAFRTGERLQFSGRTPADALPLTERWANYFRAHLGIQTEGAAASAALRAELDIGERCLSSAHASLVPFLPAVSVGVRARGAKQRLHDTIADRLIKNANVALDRIDDALGLSGGAAEGNADYQRFSIALTDERLFASLRSRLFGAHDIALRSDNNALHRLERQLKKLFSGFDSDTPGGKLISRVGQLIDEHRLEFDVYARPGSNDAVHAFLIVQLRKVARDLGAALRAASEVNGRLAEGGSPSHRERSEEVARGMIDEFERALTLDGSSGVDKQFARFRDVSSFRRAFQEASVEAVDEQLENEANALLREQAPNPSSVLLQTQPLTAIFESCRTDALVALTRLERVLGLSGSDRQASHLAEEKPQSNAMLDAFKAPGEMANAEGNILYALFKRRMATLHAADERDAVSTSADRHGQPLQAESALPSIDARDREISARLQALIEHGVCVLAPGCSLESVNVVPAMPGALPFGVVLTAHDHREVGIVVGKLVHDQLVVENALKKVSASQPPAQMDIDEAVWAMQDDVVSRLFRKQLYAPQTQRLLARLQRGAAIASHPDRAIRRAATFQGMVADEDLQAVYRQIFRELKTGEQIVLEEGWHAGLDADGTGTVVSLTDRLTQGRPESRDATRNFLNIPLNIFPNLQWQPYVGLSRGRRLTMVRTVDGVEIALDNLEESVCNLTGVKMMWGAGRFEQNRIHDVKLGMVSTALGLGYGGIELIPNLLGITFRNDNGIVLHVKEDGQGSAEHVVAGLMSGETTVSDLLDAAGTLIEVSRSSQRFDSTVDAQVVIAAVGIFTPKSDSHRRFKIVGSGLLQVTGELKSTQGQEVRRNPAGTETTETGMDVALTGNRKWIGVTEMQGSYIKDAKSPLSPHSKVGGLLEIQEKIPTWIELFITDFGPAKKLTFAPSITRAENGDITNVSYGLTTRYIDRRRLPQLSSLERYAPDVADIVLHIADNATKRALPIDITLELWPRAARALNTLSSEGRQLSVVLDNPDSWRITRLSVSQAHAYRTAAFAGLSLFRYRSDASNTWVRPDVGSVQVIYPSDLEDAGGSSSAKIAARARGELSPGGEARPFDALT